MKITNKRRLIYSNEYVVERTIKGASKVFVSIGEKVKPEDIIARTKSYSIASFNIAKELGVKPQEVRKFLIKKEGENIGRGELVAAKKGIFKFSKKEIRSKFEGSFLSYSEASGDIFIRSTFPDASLTAGCWGEVAEVNNDSVKINSRVHEIEGVKAFGQNVVAGFLSVPISENGFLLAGAVNSDSAGKILVAGALLTREVYSKAKTIGVLGIITGGIHYFDDLSGDLPFVVTEGFGAIPIFDEAMEILKKFDGYYVFIDPIKQKLVIPLPPDQWKNTVSAPFGNETELSVNQKVRIIGDSYYGEEGVIKSINLEPSLFPSALSSPSCDVGIKQGVVKVSVYNLEGLV